VIFSDDLEEIFGKRPWKTEEEEEKQKSVEKAREKKKEIERAPDSTKSETDQSKKNNKSSGDDK
jgi:hypothetical protein